MASAWRTTRTTPKGKRRHVIRFRTGGRESAVQYAGSFSRRRDADARLDFVRHELAAGRVPDLQLVDEAARMPTLADAARAWQESRVDVAENTRLQHRSAVRAMLPTLGSKRVDRITVGDVTELVADLSKTRKRETTRKSLLALGMILDFAGVSPNVARDHAVTLPREVKPEIVPPTAAAVEAVARLLPERYRLPLAVLDASGMARRRARRAHLGRRRRAAGTLARLGGRQQDADCAMDLFPSPPLRGRHRARATRRSRPRAQGLPGLRRRQVQDGDPAGVRRCRRPALQPHDLRHRRVTLLHLAGTPWSRIGEAVGQRNLAVTANVYSHVLADETELDYAAVLARN